MKTIALALVGFFVFTPTAQADETLDAAAVKKLIIGNTAHTAVSNGNISKNYFAPDGKIYRQFNGKIYEGTWRVNDDGTQCVEGMVGGCARIVRKDDGTYDRVTSDGSVYAKWTSIVDGKDF